MYTMNLPLFELPANIWGTNDALQASIWFAALSEGLGDNFREGMTVFDYGCGGARYLNFIHQRLDNYRYYGLEKKGGDGELVVNALGRMFSDSDVSNVHFGLLGDELEEEALRESDAVILGSIFTHLKFDKFIEIFDKFLPLLNRGGVVSFSVFLAEELCVVGDCGCYGIEDCYSVSYYTVKHMRNYFRSVDVKLTEEDFFLTQEIDNHRIFRACRS